MKKIIVCVCLTSLLSACNIYRNFNSPELDIADSLFIEEANTLEGASIADVSWKVLFTDANLKELITLGLENNTDLNNARLRVEQASAVLTSSKLAYLPSLSVSPQLSVSSMDGADANKELNVNTTLSWELGAIGSLTNAKRGAQASLQQSEAYKQAVETQLIATIATNYYSLLMLDEQLAITKATAESWSESVEVMRALMKAGQTNQMAVAQYEARKLATEASAATLESNIRELEFTLLSLLGETTRTIDRSSLDKQYFDTEISVGLPLAMLAGRPDVKQSEAALAEAFYATNVARSAFYPSISLTGLAGWSEHNGSSITNPEGWLLSAVASLVQPIFKKGVNRANLKISKAQQEQALLDFNQTLLDAGYDVNRALVQWQTAKTNIGLNNAQVEALTSALTNAELLMKHGTVNYLEILTARQSLLQAELATASSKYDEITSVVSLYRALGGGSF